MIREPLQRSIGINDVRRPLGAKGSDIRLDEPAVWQPPGGLFQHGRRIINADNRGIWPGIAQQSGTVARSAAQINGQRGGMVGDAGEKLGGGPRTLSPELQIK